jgi:uncharacterized protein YndB with AHSA1/START domain
MSAKTTKRLFSRETEVAVEIRAGAADVWGLLVDAARYPKWNSTVVSIDGEIALGKTIKLKSTLAPKRTFKLTVRDFQPPTVLVWGDALGKRTYRVTPNAGGTVTFSIHEKIGGPLFPLFARMIPPFDAAFDQFAADLKKQAESISGGRS